MTPNSAVPIPVTFAQLRPASNDGSFRSCTECSDGLIALERDHATMVFRDHAQCLFCGQIYRILDIDSQRSTDWATPNPNV